MDNQQKTSEDKPKALHHPCGEDVGEYYCEDAGEYIYALIGDCNCESFFGDTDEL